MQTHRYERLCIICEGTCQSYVESRADDSNLCFPTCVCVCVCMRVCVNPQEKAQCAAEWSRNKVGFKVVYCSSELKKSTAGGDPAYTFDIFFRHGRTPLHLSCVTQNVFCQTYIDVLDYGLSRCFFSKRLRVCVFTIVGHF